MSHWLHRITEGLSLEGTAWRYLAQSLHLEGHLEHCKDPIQVCFEYLQRWRYPHLSVQPVPVTLGVKKLFLAWRQIFPCFSLSSLSLILLPGTTENSPAVPLCWTLSRSSCLPRTGEPRTGHNTWDVASPGKCRGVEITPLMYHQQEGKQLLVNLNKDRKAALVELGIAANISIWTRLMPANISVCFGLLWMHSWCALICWAGPCTPWSLICQGLMCILRNKAFGSCFQSSPNHAAVKCKAKEEAFSESWGKFRCRLKSL